MYYCCYLPLFFHMSNFQIDGGSRYYMRTHSDLTVYLYRMLRLWMTGRRN